MNGAHSRRIGTKHRDSTTRRFFRYVLRVSCSFIQACGKRNWTMTLDDFTVAEIDTGETTIFVRHAGRGLQLSCCTDSRKRT
jgi:hypothetical protein